MMEATSISETSVNVYQITRFNNPENGLLHINIFIALENQLKFASAH